MAIAKGSPTSSPAVASQISDKPFFRIGEVARAVGVEPHVLRYWEREFRGIKPQKSSRGQRVYSKRDLDLLVQVRELLYAQGFTIAGAKKKLSRKGMAESAEAELTSAATTQLPAVAQPQALSRLAAKAQSQGLPSPAAPPATIPAAEVRNALLSLRQEFENFLAELR